MSRLYKGSVEYSEYTTTDKDLEEACKRSYSNNLKEKHLTGMNYFSSYHYRSGLDADVYYNDKNLVFVFRGTKGLTDYKNDFAMGINNHVPAQMYDADDLWNRLQDNDMFPNRNVIATGHSLGGSVAVYLGNKYGDRTVAFCPYGIGNIVKQRSDVSNIINYGNPDDPAFMNNFEGHIGKTKFVFNQANFQKKYNYKGDRNYVEQLVDANRHFHMLEKYGDIEFATDDITGQEFLNKVHRTYGGSIESAIEKYTQNSYKDIMQNSSNCPGYVDVKSYTRDGKEVSGYRRDCPIH